MERIIPINTPHSPKLKSVNSVPNTPEVIPEPETVPLTVVTNGHAEVSKEIEVPDSESEKNGSYFLKVSKVFFQDYFQKWRLC